jgi:hypothetical protein
MRPDPQEIVLGELRFTIRPLTLGQIRKIETLLLDPEKEWVKKGSTEQASAIAAVALSRDYPQKIAALDEIETTAPEMRKAMGVILRLGGFIEQSADSTWGESPAAGTEAPIGDTSTAA